MSWPAMRCAGCCNPDFLAFEDRLKMPLDEVISQHLQPGVSGIWQSTEQWDDEYSWDRTWS